MTERNLIRPPEVKAMTSLSRSEMYKRSQEGTFPRSIRIGNRSSAWVKEEVQAWVNERIAKRDAGEAA